MKRTNDRISIKFGEELKALRNEMGISLREAQEMIGTDLATNSILSQHENGGYIGLPGPRLLKKLCAFYGGSVRELLEIAGYTEND